MNGMEPFAGDFELYAYKILIKEPVKKETIDALYNKMVKDINDLYGEPNKGLILLFGSEEKYIYNRIKHHILFSEYDRLVSRYKNAQYLRGRVSKGLCRVVLLKLFIHKWKNQFLHMYYSPDGGKGFLKSKKEWYHVISSCTNL